MSEEMPRQERRMRDLISARPFPTVLAARGKAMEAEYADCYQQLVRMGLRPQLRKRYRR